MEMLPTKISLVAATLVCVYSSLANAATVTNNLSVTANVSAVCAITSVTGLVFDIMPTPTSSPQTDTTGAIEVNCSTSTSYSIGLNNGLNPPRQMENGSIAGEFLSYELYRDSSRTLVWGDIGSGNELTGLVGTGIPQTQTVYGRVAAQSPAPAPGIYSDTVLITVEF